MIRWTTPKTNWTRDDSENVEDFNRQKDNVEYISTVVMPLLGLSPNFEEIDDVGIEDIPLETILNRLESNIAEIGRILSLAYPDMSLLLQQSPVSGTIASNQMMRLPRQTPLLGDWQWGKKWYPEGIAPDYTDANRWENNMLLVHQWANKQPAIYATKFSGTFIAGQANFLPKGVV